MRAVSYSAAEIAGRGLMDLPSEFVSAKHLIYSSPATLAFNSPGAEGFGVKRAGLAVPDSIMLLVAPGCCGRNTTLISRLPGYDRRFFYYMMDEADLITGRHLRQIPQAVCEVVESLDKKPSVVMICITCVDALLGTDMERVCRKAEEACGIPVRPCYMYALTREGSNPPMVHVRQSLYSLLDELPKRADAVNILGFFAPLIDDCELYGILDQIGVHTVREISRCGSYAEFKQMAEANFNLVLNPEARFAARDLSERLGIPYIELKRFYLPDRIKSQYDAFGAALGVKINDQAIYGETCSIIKEFYGKYGKIVFSVGECMNSDPFEMASALLTLGFDVSEVYGTVTDENFFYIKQLSILKPGLRIYSNMEPTMIYYDSSESDVDITLGKDAAWYHPDSLHLYWNEDVQPFGYRGVQAFWKALEQLILENNKNNIKRFGREV